MLELLKCDITVMEEVRVRLYVRSNLWTRSKCYGECFVDIKDVLNTVGEVEFEKSLSLCDVK